MQNLFRHGLFIVKKVSVEHPHARYWSINDKQDMEIGDIKIRDAAIFSPIASFFTLPKTNIAPEKGCVEIHDHPATLCIDTCILAFTL